MDTTKSNFINSVALCFVFFSGLWFAGRTENPPVNVNVNGQEVKKELAKNGHQCDWEDCGYAGAEEFYTDEPEGTDMYFFQITHFNHPTMTYEEVENYMWSSFEHEPRTL